MNRIYTVREKMLLVELVKAHIVENKKTDGATLADKNRAWDNIMTTYNAQPEIQSPRTSGQLRKLWNNLKQRKRKETTAQHHMLLTGGGPPERPAVDPVLAMVEDAAPSVDVSVVCPWDSTSIFANEAAARSIVEETGEEMLVEVPAVGIEQDEPEVVFPCSSTTKPTLLSSGGDDQKSTKGGGSAAATEKNARVRKIACATQQQQEVHALKLQICEEELLKVTEERKFMNQKGQLEVEEKKLLTQKAQLEMETARKILQRASDEAELAALKLEEFKKNLGVQITE